MNEGRIKMIKGLIEAQDMKLLLAIRNRYGIRTARMNRNQVTRAAIALWHECKGDWSKIGKNEPKPILTKRGIKNLKMRKKEALEKTRKIAEQLKERSKGEKTA